MQHVAEHWTSDKGYDFQPFVLVKQKHCDDFISNSDDKSLAAIEVIEKQVKKREGTLFLWRLLVCLVPYGPLCFGINFVL